MKLKNTLVPSSLLAAVLKTSPSTTAPQQHARGISTAAAAQRGISTAAAAPRQQNRGSSSTTTTVAE
eukprot:CAMPEP_0171845718 /NCGR_PEP_ID=MMETSP0992-20121227/17275_1 /TAXON_ID=483369 /ORGANISM="non described non described, Strain CCMP2098" /LENGTH=66 /DNA_ID=CAMNT_0012463845 /DNA_START=48 /DNA_END=248 /DNA_ORIENTATION=+